jgi:Zinc-binding loop region of homing endonuclease
MLTDEQMESDCIDHGKGGNNQGYGSKRVDGKSELLHRVVYCEHNNITLSSIKGLMVRHMCHNPRCINPQHLVIGTNQDNMDDMAKARRGFQTKLTVEQVLEIRATCSPGNKAPNEVNPFSYKSFAKKYGVNHKSIRKVFLRQSHKFTEQSK